MATSVRERTVTVVDLGDHHGLHASPVRQHDARSGLRSLKCQARAEHRDDADQGAPGSHEGQIESEGTGAHQPRLAVSEDGPTGPDPGGSGSGCRGDAEGSGKQPLCDEPPRR
ncbi:hypothetical protein AB0C91_08160 [Streptomyces sp. NPDC048674]|uniref:hypothetical protein n=1 Tax=Streptomyces sp. NPDC048674 TaxID=3155491 RepID=UPI003421EB43